MQPLSTVEEYDYYTRYLKVRALDAEGVARAETAFLEYKNKGVIIDGTFRDDIWTMTDEVHTVRLYFHIDPEEYRRGAGHWLNCSRPDFILCMKAYTAFLLGSAVLPSLYEILRELKQIACMTPDEVQEVKNPRLAMEFLPLLSGDSEERDLALERLEERSLAYARNRRSPRKLGDFRAYLRFDKELREYWIHADDEKQRSYFPVYLWWNLTAVLPLRPTEFLLTPADCLEKNGEEYILSVRRTLRKKGKRPVSYRIESDYEINRYEIPGWLGSEIERYHLLYHDSDTLFPPAPHGHSSRLTYIQLNTLLRKFLAEELPEKSISIHLGDTRHLAMINLMLSGGSPTICRTLAGHEDINISANYYSNLSSIIESTVYEHYRTSGQDAALDGHMYFPLTLPQNRVRIQDGWCDYPAIVEGDIRECLKNCHHTSVMGDCTNCVHYYPDRGGFRLKVVDDRRRAVDESTAFLIQMIDLVRKSQQMPESIASALSRLQDDSRRYAAALCRKYETEGR